MEWGSASCRHEGTGNYATDHFCSVSSLASVGGTSGDRFGQSSAGSPAPSHGASRPPARRPRALSTSPGVNRTRESHRRRSEHAVGYLAADEQRAHHAETERRRVAEQDAADPAAAEERRARHAEAERRRLTEQDAADPAVPLAQLGALPRLQWQHVAQLQFVLSRGTECVRSLSPSTPTLISSSGTGRLGGLVAPLSSGWALPKLRSASGAVKQLSIRRAKSIPGNLKIIRTTYR